jgi:hypothetical protein
MGADRTLFINSSWRVEDIIDTIESLYGKVEVVPTISPDYTVLVFKAGKLENGEDETRQLNVHRGSHKGGFSGTLLTLGLWGKSDEILTSVAKRLGGFYEENDCDGKLEAYEYLAEGNLDFHLRQAVIHGKTDGQNIPAFQKYLKQSEKEHKAWEKKNSEEIEKLIQNRRGK